VRISLFGNLRIGFAGRDVTTLNTNRLQSLIAYLILHGDTPQPREQLAFMLWPGSRESQARTNLRQLLHHLKRALPPECDLLAADHFSVRWRRDPACAIDTLEFLEAIGNAESARAGGDSAREIQSLIAAAQLYEDDLLPSLYDDWMAPIREDYKRRMCEALRRLATLYEERKEYAAAIPWAERLVALDSLSEAHHQALIRLHAANRDRASALRAYHQCMRVLRRELGVDPSPATRELFEQVLKAESEAEAASPAKPVSQLHKMPALIGRAAEWNLLVSAWRSAVEHGPRVAVISGEPGIGKTRLADELCQSCVRQGYAAARARCYAGQGQVAYAPVAEWLRSDAVRAGWTNLKPYQLAELARLAPEIGDRFPGIEPLRHGQPGPLAENWQRLQFYESLNAAFARSRKPMLLYLDDLQWCDASSFEWLNALLASPASSGVLVLGTVRAEETEREHPFNAFLAWLRQSNMVEEIPLEPLDAQETAELARLESAKPLASENLAEIFRSTRGNPLFVVESVRAGLRSARVHGVIAARLAQLSATSYELAGLASVVGRPFTFELLEKATDWDESSVSLALEELWRRRIVESRGASEYDFTHDRLREVAGAELSVVRQRYWHRRVARALAETHTADADAWSGQIASHFDRAAMTEEAIENYSRAAAHARRRYADAEAANALRRALELCRGFPDSDRRLLQELDLLTMLGGALVTTEGYSAAEVGETYGRALELSRRFENRDIFAILSGAWLFHIVRGDLEKARQLSLEFVRAAESDPSPGLASAGNFILGSSLFHLGRLKRVVRAHDESGRRRQSRRIGFGSIRRPGYRRFFAVLSGAYRLAPGRVRSPRGSSGGSDYGGKADEPSVRRGDRAGLRRDAACLPGRQPPRFGTRGSRGGVVRPPSLFVLPRHGECSYGMGAGRRRRRGSRPGATSRRHGAHAPAGGRDSPALLLRASGGDAGPRGPRGRSSCQYLHGIRIRNQKRRSMAVGGTLPLGRGSVGHSGELGSRARQFPARRRGGAAIRFSGVREKIVDSRRENGRELL
jgi:DNA-binding SARP family transcriptional activator